MPKKAARPLDEAPQPDFAPSDLPRMPATDNEPGAVSALHKVNRALRQRRWPAPYDRTRHEMILGDARDLGFIASESVHLIVTSPP